MTPQYAEIILHATHLFSEDSFIEIACLPRAGALDEAAYSSIGSTNANHKLSQVGFTLNGFGNCNLEVIGEAKLGT